MFGRYTKVVQGVALAALCIFVIRLYVQDNINLYIHPRYSIFALVMACLGLVLLAAWLVTTIRKKGFKPVSKPSLLTVLADSLLLLLLVLAFVLPAKPLSSQAVERKTANIPGTSQNKTTPSMVRNCLTRTPETLQEWVIQIDAFPNPDCYKNVPVSVTGFVYVPADQPLPDGYLYLGRMVISCCVVDARPYALPIKTTESFPKDSWLHVEGKIEEQTIDGTPRLVVVPTNITPTDEPKDVYGY